MRKYSNILTLMSIVILFSCSSQSQSYKKYHYLTYLPTNYENEELKNYPVIFFLHGASLRGDDINKIEKYGIPKLIKDGKDFDFIVISPQCPLEMTWASENWFIKTFEDVKIKYRIDTNKVYLTGMSLGGEGTWYIAEKHPDFFAAIAPVCGRSSNIESIKKDIHKISNMPIWLFHGEQDKTYTVTESDDIYEKLVKINKDVKYTRYPNLGHWATHDSTYKNDELYNWFLEHSKKQ